LEPRPRCRKGCTLFKCKDVMVFRGEPSVGLGPHHDRGVDRDLRNFRVGWVLRHGGVLQPVLHLRRDRLDRGLRPHCGREGLSQPLRHVGGALRAPLDVGRRQRPGAGPSRSSRNRRRRCGATVAFVLGVASRVRIPIGACANARWRSLFGIPRRSVLLPPSLSSRGPRGPASPAANSRVQPRDERGLRLGVVPPDLPGGQHPLLDGHIIPYHFRVGAEEVAEL
jgi:hypothetical protein